MKNKSNKASKYTAPKGINTRGGNLEAMAAHLRSGAGAMKHRNTPRGGSKMSILRRGED